MVSPTMRGEREWARDMMVDGGSVRIIKLFSMGAKGGSGRDTGHGAHLDMTNEVGGGNGDFSNISTIQSDSLRCLGFL